MCVCVCACMCGVCNIKGTLHQYCQIQTMSRHGACKFKEQHSSPLPLQQILHPLMPLHYAFTSVTSSSPSKAASRQGSQNSHTRHALTLWNASVSVQLCTPGQPHSILLGSITTTMSPSSLQSLGEPVVQSKRTRS